MNSSVSIDVSIGLINDIEIKYQMMVYCDNYLYVCYSVYISVNMTVVISFRIDDKEVMEIESMGYKPSDYAKKALEKELRRERNRKALEFFRKHRITDPTTTSEEMIRQDRDSR